MEYITFNHIIELNKKLTQRGLPYKIHLSDRCGGQSMRIEQLEASDDSLKDSESILYIFLEDFFAKERIALDFSEDRISFWVKR